MDNNQPLGVEFNPDGTKMYITGTSSNKVRQFNLTTAFDISTAGGGAALNWSCELTFDHRLVLTKQISLI